MSPHEEKDDNKGPGSIATCIAFTVISGVFVIARIAARVGLVRNPGPEDLLIVVSLLCSIAFVALLDERGFYSSQFTKNH